jgi:uncharacterized protein YwgA
MNINLLPIIKKIKQECGLDPDKARLQLLVYLIQANGVDLGYKFDIRHYHGLYSENLNRELTKFSDTGHLIIRVGYEIHRVTLTSLSDEIDGVNIDMEIVDHVVNKYKDESLNNLNLIAIVHYIFSNSNCSDSEVMTTILNSDNKYSSTMIQNVISYIKDKYNF